MSASHEKPLRLPAVVWPAALATLLTASFTGPAAAQEATGAFRGSTVPSGAVTHSKDGANHVLTLSPDFSIHEEPPDPHWRVVDSRGSVFLLDKLKIEGGKVNTSIVLPAYITDVSKVEMWCAFAEVVLGEALFSKPVVLK